SEWDVRKFDAFQAENHEFFEKLLQIAELPNQSAKGEDIFGRAHGLIAKTDYLGILLRLGARNALEKGDQETALRYMRASTSIASHLVEIETPSLIEGMISSSIRNKAEKSFREDFLPALANDPVALRAWRDAVFAAEPPS